MTEILKKSLDVEGATVPFYTYTIEDTQYIEFDTSKCGPPEPMVNAMAGLAFVDKGTKLVMINHKSPGGLISKIGENYDVENETLDDGRVKLIFSYKEGESEKADLSQNSCSG